MIYTDRLLLRPPGPHDSGEITRFVNDPRIYRMLADVPPHQSKAETLAWIATIDGSFSRQTGYTFALICKLSGQLTGLCSAVRPHVEDPFRIGYWMAPEFWGKGYCSEAGLALISWLEQNRSVKALVSGYFHDNPASGAVLRKLGFVPCGRNRIHSRGRAAYVGHILMARISQNR